MHVRACENRKTKGSKDGGEEQTVLVRPWNKSMDVLSWKGKGQAGPGGTTVKKTRVVGKVAKEWRSVKGASGTQKRTKATTVVEERESKWLDRPSHAADGRAKA